MGSNVTYDVTHLYDRIHPSICEVYFQVSNPKDWHSEAIDSHYDVTFKNTYYLTNTIVFSGRIRRTLVGYFLLSRYPGVGLIQEFEVKEALTKIVASVTNCKEMTYDCCLYFKSMEKRKTLLVMMIMSISFSVPPLEIKLN
ncbi:uncharacterized protein LOC104266096 [Ciona intestinalis]